MNLVVDENISTTFQTTRKQTEKLCKPLKLEDYVPQPELFVSPPKWHLAHTTWFFEEMILKKYQADYKEFHPDFSFLFNSYYQSIGERTQRADRGSMTRPSVDEVYAYRKYVDEHMISLLEENRDEKVCELVTLGLNHEEQHQELLITDLKYTLSLNPIYPVYDEGFNLLKQKNRSNSWRKVEAGIYQIGHVGEGFCFDNELGLHRVYVDDFEIADHLVTNGEFIEFIETGAYDRFDLWLDEGWTWVNENEVKAPIYWHKIEGEWHRFSLEGLIKIDRDEILGHVSFYEAQAFATWKGMRLASEFQWEIASDQFQWGDRWEWTYSAYHPYPNFKTAKGALGEYNGKFMINQMVLRGASSATAKGHSRKTYRNFFHPHYQWQVTGIRLVK